MQSGARAATEIKTILLRSITSPNGNAKILGAILMKHNDKTNKKQTIHNNRLKTFNGLIFSLMIEKTRLPIPAQMSQKQSIIPETSSFPLNVASASRMIKV